MTETTETTTKLSIKNSLCCPCPLCPLCSLSPFSVFSLLLTFQFSLFSFIWAVQGEKRASIAVFLFSYFPISLCFGKMGNLLSLLTKGYQQNTLLVYSGNHTYQGGYTYLLSHWDIDYYSQYLYIVWMYIFFHTEDRYIVLIYLYISQG